MVILEDPESGSLDPADTEAVEASAEAVTERRAADVSINVVSR